MNPGSTVLFCPISERVVRRNSVRRMKCNKWIHKRCSQFNQLPPQKYNWKWQVCSPPLTIITPSGSMNLNPSMNILQLNINGLHHKSKELEDFLCRHNIHLALIQEGHLPAGNPKPTFYKYDTILSVHQLRNLFLLTLIHNSPSYTNTTTHTQNSLNGNTLKLQSFSKIINTKLYPMPKSNHQPS